MTIVRNRWLEIVTVAIIGVSLFRSMTVVADVTQGDVQRIMYVHVPSAWLAFLAFMVTMVGSAAWLRTKDQRWDRLAASSAEIGVVFTGLAIVAGMIWAKPVWGQFWTWEPRLVTTALLFFIYLGYLALRRAVIDPVQRARRAAIMGIVAAVQIPIVYYSVNWWRSLHQPSSARSIDTPLRITLLLGVVAFTFAYAVLLRRRLELARLEEELDAKRFEQSQSVAGADITAPSLASHPHD
ncbi:MAG: cytochrome c biogenesis protein CcsA [Acidimicrobiia bacterium]|nr:cytochrome c biogenesis protein CcsA [Acidimicrobiia bacterium]MBT8193117.1 cytochrome c biogenesis protein CcsA [Acidimicrobiia bacterium]MBT8247193.1 cytochrome c biogenesis protein CcsA [Acidimicrobiia bacterium]NNF87239.1 cytochrome c biogenesis protein CcsA [Acidimicrobiia bacterium]NNJ47140.1 cytochrome c biogenesis protein CcsA [Acidimicrobiia bacterium]